MSTAEMDTRGAVSLRQAATALATIVPALVLAYPLLIWPLLYADHTVDLVGIYQPRSEPEGFLLSRLYLVPLLGLAFGSFVAIRPKLTRQERTMAILFAVFLGLCVGSSLWSLDAGYTLRKIALQLILVGTLGLSVIASNRPQAILNAIFAVLLFSVVANLLAVITRPPGPIGHEGIFPHKNSLGGFAAIAFLFGIYYFRRGPLAAVPAVFVAVGALVLLVVSQSKTSLGLAIIVPGIAVLVGAMARTLRLPFIVTLPGGIVVALLTFQLTAGIFHFDRADVLILLFDDATFTGRTDLWAFVIDRIAEAPLLGYGFEGIWDIGPESPKYESPIAFVGSAGQAHNGYLDLILQLGIPGFGIFLVLLATLLVQTGRLLRTFPRTHTFVTSLLLLIIAYNTMESNWFRSLSPFSMLFVVLAFVTALPESERLRRIRPEPMQ